MRFGNVIDFPRATRTHEPHKSSRDPDLALFVAHELIITATWIAATAGVINRCYLDRKQTSPRFLQGCLPPDLSAFILLSRTDADAAACIMYARCRELQTYLAAARRALEACLEGKTIAPAARRQQQIKTCDLWQACCDSALLAIYAIEDSTGFESLPFEQEQIRSLIDALISARSGGAPFHRAGIPAPPEWVEKRRTRRFTVNAFAKLTVDGRATQVFVLNVSLGGLGIDHAAGLAEGTLVSIQLENGRCFVGRVIWCIGRRAGIKLRRNLRPDDPLLAG